MNLRRMAKKFYKSGWRKLINGYHIRNWIERKKNTRLLKTARELENGKAANGKPLVSVVMATYNLGKVLTERTIPSILRQTYQNFELLIVGDHCTDDTEKLVKAIGDDRIRFVNLEERGKYPEKPGFRWLVAGVTPRNKGLEMCRGEWIAAADDDDEFTEDHIEALLRYALDNDLEMVYGKVKMEKEPGKWEELGSYPLEAGRISHVSAMYRSRLNFMRYDINSWKIIEPADWNFWRRMKEMGVRVGFLDRIIAIHYLEGTRRGA